MNSKIKKLIRQAGGYARDDDGQEMATPALVGADLERLVMLTVSECSKLNLRQSHELDGVMVDVRDGDGFDEVCEQTVLRVKNFLSSGLEDHFKS